MSRGGLLRRLLPEDPPGPRRLTDPATGAPLRAAVVADVDLDTGTVTAHQPLVGFEHPPEGVHALVWWHGVPLGEVTMMGEPAAVLPQLVTTARAQLAMPLLQHALEDALGSPGGLCRAVEDGLAQVAHPTPAIGSAAPPTVSVAVCTRGRPELLRHCLTALAALDGPVLEVLVVDNAAGDDGTRRVVEQFPSVRYVSETRQGLDFARNRALLEAVGDVVAFTDDDVLVHPRWVQGLVAAFLEEPTAVAVTGLVVAAELATPSQLLFEVGGGFGRGFRRSWYSSAVADGEVAAGVFGGTGAAGTGANMAFRRQHLLDLGGFDTALDVGTLTGGGGDLEAFFRVVAAGGLLVYEPSAVVRHVHRRTRDELVAQMRGHGTGSYSFFLGAGARYGPRQRRSFARLSAWWVLHGHLRGWAETLASPQALPVALRGAETRGALDAVVGRYYRRAEQEAARREREVPGPSPVRPVRTPAGPPQPRVADAVVDVELGAGAVLAPADPGRPGRRTRVRVLRRGEPEHVFAIPTRSVPLSSNRLRRALVDELGPALVEPGLSWNGPDTVLGGPSARVLPTATGLEPLTAERVEVIERLLAGSARAPLPLRPTPQPVTVLLCTRNRPHHLRRSMEALAALGPEGHLQLLVVDNSSDPTATADIVGRFPAAELVHEPRAGLSRARNTGLPHCRGDVVVLVDDDVEVRPGWLERLLAPFDDAAVWAVTGSVLPADIADLETQVFEDYGGLNRGPHRKTYTREWLVSHRGHVPTWNIGATANAAFRRSALDRLGLFVESLGPGNSAGVGEDTEYFYRVLRAGGRIRYEPTARVLHAHRSSREALAEQLEAYSAGHVAYHLEVAVRYRDLRGLPRVLGLPRFFARQHRMVTRGHDDFPAELVRAQLRGHLSGPRAWWVSRRRSR